jgi:hypothetical protein
LDKLAMLMIEGKTVDGQTVKVDVDKGKLVIKV